MWKQPWFLSIVAGLIATGILYILNKKECEEKKFNNVQFGVIFLIVAGLVYGSCIIVDGEAVLNTVKDCSAKNTLFTGTPSF